MIFFGDGWCKWKIGCFLYLPFGLFINKSTYSFPTARQQNNFLILLHFYLNSFLFIFWNCFLPKFPSSLKGILYTFNCTSDNFWSNTFNLCPTKPYDLVNSLLCNFVYFSCCLTDKFWCYFSRLINNICASVGKVVPIEKTSCLTTRCLFFSQNSFSRASTILWVNSYLDISSSASSFSLLLHCFFILSGLIMKYPITSPLLILSFSK